MRRGWFETVENRTLETNSKMKCNAVVNAVDIVDSLWGKKLKTGVPRQVFLRYFMRCTAHTEQNGRDHQILNGSGAILIFSQPAKRSRFPSPSCHWLLHGRAYAQCQHLGAVVAALTVQ